MPNNSPQFIGKYELEQFLGGGMSAVYRARDTLMSRTVAIKILKDAHLDEPVARRFMLEAQIAGNLNHENVVRTYDFGFDPEGRPYMVLEYLEGENLAEAIKGRRTGSIADRARIGAELAAALEYIHPRNVIHRDLKPANIFVTSTGQVKLMDFGIARLQDVSITQAGMTMGTPGYMAPEQVRGDSVTKSADIYAFGVLLWEMFTGERAFSAATLERVFYLVLNEQLRLDKLRSADVPEELVKLIGKCTEKEAFKRPENLQGIQRELLRLSGGGAGMVVPPPPSQTETVMMPPQPAAPAARVTVRPKPEAAPAAPPPPSPRVTVRPKPEPAPATPPPAAPKPAVPPPVAAAAPAPPAPAPVRRAPAPAAALNPTLMYMGGGALVAIVGALILFLVTGNSDSRKQGGDASGSARVETTTGPMMLVSGGVFRFGPSKESVDLPAFYIDRTEVPNRAYAQYASATGASFASGAPDLPAVSLTFEEAQGFCTWAGKSLPTWKQWEKAARGTDGRAYPWGETVEARRANVGAGRSGSLKPVDGYPNGASAFGALQMVGNAWEWVDETAAPSAEATANFARMLSPPPAPGDRWVRIRGGSFMEPLDPKVMSDAVTVPARYKSPIIGFRCAKRAD